MSLFDRVIEALLPSQELMRLERAYICRTGHNPTAEQERRWKKEIKRNVTAH